MTTERLPHKGRLLAVLLMGPFMAQADATIANVATPSIRESLGASGAALELVVGGYMIAFAMLLITGARLGQTHGYRRIFVVGVATFTAASIACGLAPSPAVLVAARVAQGAGAALMFPQTLTGIQLNFEGAERGRAIGLYALALSTGAVAGQIAGGGLISLNVLGVGWRAIFLVNAPIGALVVLAAVRHLPADDARATRDVDLRGVATLSAAIVLIVLPLVLGRTEGWPAWTWIALAASVPVLASFVAVERRVAARGGAPLMHLAVIARPTISRSLAALLLATGTYYALLFTLAQYLQQGLGRSPFLSGLTLVPWVAAFGAAGQLVRRLPARLRPFIPSAGCALLTMAYVVVSAALFDGRHGEALLLAVLAVGGLGLGVQFSGLIAHLSNAVPRRYAPDISGVSTTLMQIGGTVGVAAFGTLYFALAASGATHAFAVVTAVFAAVALLAAAAAYSARPKW